MAVRGSAALHLTAVLQLTVVVAWPQIPAPLDLTTAQLKPEVVNGLELAVAVNPEDVAARTKLILHYLVTGANEPRARHVLWLVEHHPEAEVFRIPTLFQTPGPLQDIQAFSRAAALWRRQAALQANDPRVVLNVAYFFWSARDDFYESEVWLKRARDVEPSNQTWRSRLALLYSGAILASAGWPAFPSTWSKPGIAAHAKEALDSSADGLMVWQAGNQLEAAQKLPGDRMRPAGLAEYGKALQKRATKELGYQPPVQLP